MTRRRCKLVSLLLVVLYGGMMLYGQGLHELIDCGHHHGPGRALCGAGCPGAADDHAGSACHEDEQDSHDHSVSSEARHDAKHTCQCSHGAADEARHADRQAESKDPRTEAPDEGLAARSADDEIATHDADCLICQFHSQGQLRTPAAAPTPRRVPSLTLSRQIPLVAAGFALGVHSPRGPPA